MSVRKVETVCKRNGETVPYDEQKIADAIAHAARSSGQENATIGVDLASAVTMYLERHRENEQPSSEEIQQLVEKVLFDTGHSLIARAYIVHREKKGHTPSPEQRPWKEYP